MQINFVLPSLNPSGGVSVVKDYCTWLNEHGHDCLVYYPVMESWKHPKTHHFIYGAHYWFPSQIRDADITIATAWNTAKFVLDLPDRCGIKAYFIQHYETLWNERAKKTYDYPLKQIVVSHWLYKILSLFHQTNPYIVENGIKLPNSVYKNATKKNITILTSYRQERWKGTEEGLAALELVYDKHPECRYQVYGWKIPDMEIHPWIEPFENPTDKELNELYYNADIFLYPSHSEGFGLPPLEAMARMCAVVTTNVGAVPEYTNDGEYAVLVEPEDVPSMWLAVKTLIENKELRTAYQVLAYQASKRWSFDTSAERFEQCLKSLVQS